MFEFLKCGASALLVLALLGGCRESTTEQPKPNPPEPAAPVAKPTPKANKPTLPKKGGFFDDKKVFEGASDPKSEVASVPCVGAKTDGSDDAVFHPQKVRGTVWGPFGTYAYSPSWLERLLISEAHAHPLKEEKPVVGQQVTLQRVDAHGRFIGEAIMKATTDKNGRYCFRLPDGMKLRTDLVVFSGSGDTLMRRNLASRSTNDIFLQPEALFQVLLDNKVDLARLPRREFGNLYSLTDTIVDVRAKPPLKLKPGATIKPSVAEVKKRLLSDERFMAKLALLKTKYTREGK